MKIVPCARCGYHSPAAHCPHCGHHAQGETGEVGGGLPPNGGEAEGSNFEFSPGTGAGTGVAPLARNPLEELWIGALALPRGLHLLFTTRGIKRWLVPPMLLTVAVLIGILAWLFEYFDALITSHVSGEVTFDAEWAWLEAREGLGWAKAGFGAVIAGAEWVVNFFLGMLLSKPLKLLGWFLLGSLASWYTFSIAYEALAGPFLDEIQARLETKWFGADPRGRLERPNDIPVESCVRLSLLASALASVLLIVLFLVPGLAWWLVFPFLAIAVLIPVLVDQRYGPWLRWVASVEGRAAWASLQASLLTGLLLLFALPLYFVPGFGYVLFALVAGFGAAVGLLDIPLERRGWSLRQRASFVMRHLHAFLAFGIAAGFLLAIPLIGPLVMVPAASLGGQWAVCRLDKSGLRARARQS